jgi:hypothetical protein
MILFRGTTDVDSGNCTKLINTGTIFDSSTALGGLGFSTCYSNHIHLDTPQPEGIF